MYLGDAWWQKAIIYEVYVDKFAGNFAGMIQKLDYLSDLGINTIWLLPHYPSPMIDGGYDVADYYGVRPDLGTLGDFENFVREAHNRNLKVITDLVLNHTSNTNFWFKEKRDWYMWSSDPTKFSQAFVHFGDVKNNCNWIKNEETGDYYYATFYPEQPDLNWDNPEVLAEMLNVMDFWIAKGVDGFRLDAISRLVKRENTNCYALPETHQIIKNIRSHIDSVSPDIVLLAEAGGWPNEAHTFFGVSDECQLVMHFPLAIKMLSTVRNHNLEPLSEMWSWTPPAPNNCAWAVFLTNHDSNDIFFLGSDEDKKEILNRVDPNGNFIHLSGQSVSSRLNEMCFGKNKEIVWATKLMLEQPGTPIIYYGNEIGMHNADLQSIPKDARDYVRGQFDWTEAKRQISDPGSLLNSIRALIQQRHKLGI
jgi:maltose alpha-D-glucosyltransferase / alpha-amylase